MQDGQSPRVTPLTPPDWDDEIMDALGAFPHGLKFVLTQWNENTGDLRGLNTLGFLATHPPLAKAFLTFNKYVAQDSTLSTRDKEVLILRTCWLNKFENEFFQHTILGRRAGLSDEEIVKIQTGPGADGLPDSDVALLSVVDDLKRIGSISDSSWEQATACFSRTQIMDMVFVVGCYNVLGLAVNSFRLPMDEGVEGLDEETRARMYDQEQ